MNDPLLSALFKQTKHQRRAPLWFGLLACLPYITGYLVPSKRGRQICCDCTAT